MDIRFLEPYKDMFNYYNLITKINPNYSLCFDKKNKNFVVVNFANNNEICMKFNDFSVNIEKYLQKMQISNAKEIFNSIEENNEKVNRKNTQNLINNVETRVEELLWLSRRTNNILPSDINKIIEV